MQTKVVLFVLDPARIQQVQPDFVPQSLDPPSYREVQESSRYQQTPTAPEASP